MLKAKEKTISRKREKFDKMKLYMRMMIYLLLSLTLFYVSFIYTDKAKIDIMINIHLNLLSEERILTRDDYLSSDYSFHRRMK